MPQRRRGRVLTAVGLTLVLAGLSVLGWVGWQLWGTNWQSERLHDDLVSQAERAWASPDTDDTEVVVPTDRGDVSAIVRIPAFGDSYAVPLLEGTTDDVLAAGFGRFTESARPGEAGNFAVAAHRVTHGEPLRDMPLLEVGDEVVIETSDATHTYVLDTAGDALTVTFTDTWVVAERPTNPEPGGVQPSDAPELITLTTCSELFHTDNRLIAFGHLVSSERR